MEILTQALSRLGFDWQIALANLVNFALVFLLLNKLLFKKIKTTIQERKQVIQEGIDNATKAEIALANSKIAADDIVESARHESAGIIAAASHKAAEYIADAEHRAYQVEQQLVKEAHENAAAEFSKEVHERTHSLADMIVLSAEAVIKSQIVGDDDHHSFIRQQLAGVAKK